MLLNELFDDELNEGPTWDKIKNLAAVGAVAGGLGAGVHGMMNKVTPPVAPTQTQQVSTPQKTDISPVQKASQAATAEPEKKAEEPKTNPNFPKSLENQDKIDPQTRVQNFVSTMVPLINAENQKILQTRVRLQNDIKLIKSGRKLDVKESAWVNQLSDRYGEDNLEKLLKMIDIIPPSLALAQAAIESGWGQDEKARQANVFYGQKSFGKTTSVAGPYGEKYSAFESPQDSIRAYMFNLNSHDRYDDLRKIRDTLRKKNQPISGLHLLPGLLPYTDTGKIYPQKLAKIIKTHNLSQFDNKK